MRLPQSVGFVNPRAKALGRTSVFDRRGVRYDFFIYGIRAIPSAFNAVYMFCRLQGSAYGSVHYKPIYIGRARVLQARLFGHERKDEAIRRGATHLLVHIPGPYANRIRYDEAERRLIASYNPLLNVRHRRRAATRS